MGYDAYGAATSVIYCTVDLTFTYWSQCRLHIVYCTSTSTSTYNKMISRQLLVLILSVSPGFRSITVLLLFSPKKKLDGWKVD